MAETARATTRLIVLLIALAFCVFVSYDFIRVTMSDNQLGSYVDYVVQLGGNQNRPAEEVRTLILTKASELGLPISGKQIHVTGQRQSLRASISYAVDIRVPVLQRVLYHKTFNH